jgi:hypothetical protein
LISICVERGYEEVIALILLRVLNYHYIYPEQSRGSPGAEQELNGASEAEVEPPREPPKETPMPKLRTEA